ncbi:MAG: hypothetical protein ACI8W8_002955 [Rhodothermales bacterium]|jgi:hypothetical protein
MDIPEDGIDISTPTKEELNLIMTQMAKGKAKTKPRKKKQ